MARFPTTGVGKGGAYRSVNLEVYGKNHDYIYKKRKPKKMQKPFLYRQHTGSLEASMKTLVTLTSFKALEDHVRNQFGIDKNAKIEVKPYVKDIRNGWDTYIVTADERPTGFTNGPVKE